MIVYYCICIKRRKEFYVIAIRILLHLSHILIKRLRLLYRKILWFNIFYFYYATLHYIHIHRVNIMYRFL